MHFSTVCAQFPKTVALWPNTSAFYRSLHYHGVIVESGTAAAYSGAVGSGRRIDWHIDHVRIVAIRRLIMSAMDSVGLSSYVNDAIEEAIYRGVTEGNVEIPISRDVSLLIKLPDEIAAELFPPVIINTAAATAPEYPNTLKGRTPACAST